MSGQEKSILSLAKCPVGRKAKVSHIHTDDRQALRKILAMGALPDMDILLIQNFPSYVFQIGDNSRFSIDKELASLIYVQTTQ